MIRALIVLLALGAGGPADFQPRIQPLPPPPPREDAPLKVRPDLETLFPLPEDEGMQKNFSL